MGEPHRSFVTAAAQTVENAEAYHHFAGRVPALVPDCQGWKDVLVHVLEMPNEVAPDQRRTHRGLLDWPTAGQVWFEYQCCLSSPKAFDQWRHTMADDWVLSGYELWTKPPKRQPYSYLQKSYYAYPNPSLSRPGTDLTPRQVPNVERRDAWNLPMTTRVPHGPRHPAAPADQLQQGHWQGQGHRQGPMRRLTDFMWTHRPKFG